jgi:hypothetical protein
MRDSLPGSLANSPYMLKRVESVKLAKFSPRKFEQGCLGDPISDDDNIEGPQA